LLHAVGMPELVMNNYAEYESLAVKLATNKIELGKYKSQLFHGLKQSTLFDTEKFTKDLEGLYLDLMAR